MGPWRLLALLGALCLGAGLSVGRPAALEKAALRFEDGKFALRALLGAAPRPDPGVVVVAVDAASVSRVGRWPWRRDVLGALLGRLGEADLVALDAAFPAPAGPDEDAALARAFGDGGVILGYRLGETAGRGLSPVTPDQLEAYSYPSSAVRSPVVGVKEFEASEGNVPLLAEAGLSAGFLNLEPDPDGRYRRYPLAYVHKGHLLPPLAVQLVQYRLDRKARVVLDGSGVRSFELGAVRISRTNALPLDFADPGRIPQFSAAAVLAGRTPASAFRGKIVLVGVTAPRAAELRPTPLQPRTPEVFVHFTAASNLLRDALLRESRALDAALLLLSCLFVLASSLAGSGRARLALYLPALALPYLVGGAMLTLLRYNLHDAYALGAGFLLAVLLEGTALLTGFVARRETLQSSTDA